MFSTYGGYLQSYGVYDSEYVPPVVDAEVSEYTMKFATGFNRVLLGKDNEVKINFTFEDDFAVRGLDNFTEIVVEIDGERWSSIEHPDFLRIESNKLELSIGDITLVSEGVYFPLIVGYNDIYDDGYELSSDCKNELAQPIIVCE